MKTFFTGLFFLACFSTAYAQLPPDFRDREIDEREDGTVYCVEEKALEGTARLGSMRDVVVREQYCLDGERQVWFDNEGNMVEMQEDTPEDLPPENLGPGIDGAVPQDRTVY